MELTGTDKDTLGMGTALDRVGHFRTAWDTWGHCGLGHLETDWHSLGHNETLRDSLVHTGAVILYIPYFFFLIVGIPF